MGAFLPLSASPSLTNSSVWVPLSLVYCMAHLHLNFVRYTPLIFQPIAVFRNVAFIGTGKMSILPRSFYDKPAIRSKCPPSVVARFSLRLTPYIGTRNS